MILSSPAKAPPQMNRMLVVSTCRNSCCGCLRPPCGGTRGGGAFHQLQQRLLDALARHVAGDRGIVGFAGNLVDLVDVDDAALGLLDIIVGGLEQLQDDVLDILADIAGLGQRRRVGHGEGHVENSRQRLGEQRLAAAGRADQQDVRLGELDLIAGLDAVGEPLVMVVDRDRQHALGAVLPDHIIVEHLVDFRRSRNAVASLDQGRLGLLADDVVAQLDAFVADEDGRARNQLADLMLRLAAEAAVKRALAVAAAGKLSHTVPCLHPSRVERPAGHAKPVYRTIKLARCVNAVPPPKCLSQIWNVAADGARAAISGLESDPALADLAAYPGVEGADDLAQLRLLDRVGYLLDREPLAPPPFALFPFVHALRGPRAERRRPWR